MAESYPPLACHYRNFSGVLLVVVAIARLSLGIEGLRSVKSYHINCASLALAALRLVRIDLAAYVQGCLRLSNLRGRNLTCR